MNMLKRAIAGVGLALCIASTPAIARTPPSKPNILVILIDDMGWGDLNCYDKAAAPTPRIDQLAKEGIRFNQFYVTAPICSPSRCSLVTGQYPQRWRIDSYLGGYKSNENRGIANWLDVKAPTVARSLKAAGYATGHFGKWHLGGGRDIGEAPLITEYGYDETLTQFEGLGDRLLIEMDAYDGKGPKKNGLALDSEKLGRGKTTWVNRTEVTTLFAQRAIEFLDKNTAAGKPSFIDLWPDDVHSPFFPPKDLRTKEAKRALYRAVVEATDRQLTPILDHIKNTPALRDNTLIVLMSDNGPEPGAGTAGPMRGTKTNLWEGGIREPFIVWSPKLIDAKAVGSVDETSVLSSLDLAPTFLKLASAQQLEKPDGEDISDAIFGKRPLASRGAALFWRRPPDRPGNVDRIFPDLAMRDGDWKLLCMFDGSSPQLYNLKADIGESNNLAGNEVERVTAMQKQLLDWNRSLPEDKPQKPSTQPTANDG